MTSALTELDDQTVDLRVLRIEDIERLRLGWWSRFDPDEVERTLSRAPGLSAWAPASSEYLLAGPWRHRHDIINVVELVAIRHPIELVRKGIELARASGIRLFLAVEMTERRQSAFYDRVGMTQLEEVLSYERSTNGVLRIPGPRPDIRRIERLDEASLQVLRELDWDAFPWLWRNADDEFREYFNQSGVELHVLTEGDSPLGYIGLSSYPGWGHIDRVAVLPGRQGRGHGRRLTEFAMERLVLLGATRLGLSTQRRNTRSQALYEKLGFKRQMAGEYRIYGVLLDSNDSINELVMGSQE